MKKKNRFWLWLILSLLWLAVIFWHSSMPAAASDAESRGLLAVLRTVFPFLTHHFLRKLAHFVSFALLGVLFTCTFRNAKNFLLLKPLACCLMAAICDETLQLFVEGRAGSLSDVWLDFSGILTGALLTWLIYRIRK